MNQIRLLAFAQARDALGFSEKVLSVAESDSPAKIISQLGIEKLFTGWRVALDCEYVEWDAPVGARSEMALIPPVSGG
jgi:molybdopterin converting factor small subunit